MKQILFNTEMVRAILAGQKTVTRRIVKPQPKMHLSYIFGGTGAGKWGYPPPNVCNHSGWDEKYIRVEGLTSDDERRLWLPPCHGDDTLYVRETWNYGIIDRTDYEGRNNYFWFEELQTGKKSFGNLGTYYYRADYSDEEWAEVEDMKWHPSIHMPREAARIFLRVTDVRVERLQDIQERGEWSARDEGFVNDIDLPTGTGKSAARHFADLWDSCIKPEDRDKYGWEANPWVWVIGFERIEEKP